jgi:hypothetical protein
MGAGQYYDPRSVPQSAPGSGWTLLSHPEQDRVHVWVRSLGELDVKVTRKTGEWWEIEITDPAGSMVHEVQASSGVAAFKKVDLWAWSRMEIKV